MFGPFNFKVVYQVSSIKYDQHIHPPPSFIGYAELLVNKQTMCKVSFFSAWLSDVLLQELQQPGRKVTASLSVCLLLELSLAISHWLISGKTNKMLSVLTC